MGFQGLLGNSRIKRNLASAMQKDKISHFYVVSGPEGSGRSTLIRLLTAAIQCEGEDRPCLQCEACRKAMAGTHPDIITVDNKEKKHIPIDQIREARADVYIRPNEGKKKIYVIPRANDMRMEAQNALLKVLEEPPAYGVFILRTDNPEKLLPTIRSRCVELSLTPLSDKLMLETLRSQFPEADEESLTAAIARSGGYLGQALLFMKEGAALYPETQQFLQAYLDRDVMALLETLVPMEKYHRTKLIPILEQWAYFLQQALVCRTGTKISLRQARE
ncbi:MAG: DNA polymerase III subunit delta', partial [Oscillospiraceae bacterium]|nr:DNA polymerase III subunit delta' [Oscillospiraceae bacterium]